MWQFLSCDSINASITRDLTMPILRDIGALGDGSIAPLNCVISSLLF